MCQSCESHFPGDSVRPYSYEGQVIFGAEYRYGPVARSKRTFLGIRPVSLRASGASYDSGLKGCLSVTNGASKISKGTNSRLE